MQIRSLAVQVPRREDKGWHGLGLQEDAVQEMQQNYTRDSLCLPKAHVHRRHKHTPEPQAGWTCWCGLAQGHLICGHLKTLHIHS